ncbi:MAG: response regulator transcription factor [Anaerolineales bacterium]
MLAKLLVIDDDAALNEMLTRSLGAMGFEILTASSGKAGIERALRQRPDLILLDVMMPEMDGWEVCRRLRAATDLPIIMLTAKDDRAEVIRGFELGVDDYVTKPFDLRELELRIRAVLKRYQLHRDEVYDDGVLRIDLRRQRVFLHSEPIHLTSTEFKLLRCLVQHAGAVISHQKLLTDVWGADYIGATANLALYIRYLREKLEPDPGDPRYIRTQWGEGYWFCPTPAENP